MSLSRAAKTHPGALLRERQRKEDYDYTGEMYLRKYESPAELHDRYMRKPTSDFSHAGGVPYSVAQPEPVSRIVTIVRWLREWAVGSAAITMFVVFVAAVSAPDTPGYAVEWTIAIFVGGWTLLALGMSVWDAANRYWNTPPAASAANR